jgi:hypothetical protein
MSHNEPLGRPPYTMFHNYVLDQMMKTLSANAWKVLCVAIRQTWGWQDPETASGRKESDVISYSQFMSKTGIRGRATVARAIKECLNAGCLRRRQVGTDARSGNPIYAYSLNTDYDTSGSKTEPLGSSKTEPLSGSKTELTKETPKETTKQSTGVGLSPREQNSLALLTEIGVTQSVAQDLAKECTYDQINGWAAYARQAANLTNPAGLVVAHLKARDPAPKLLASPAAQTPGGVFR